MPFLTAYGKRHLLAGRYHRHLQNLDNKEPLLPASDAAAFAASINELTDIAVAAAGAIQRVRDPGTSVRRKPDGSPVTAADENAEAVIREGLAHRYPDVPMISEEGAEHERPANASACYFLVDPLDGTREFISGRDEYTVNIALVAEGTPVLGIIVAPALGLIWRGIVGRGAEKMLLASGKMSSPETIHTRARPPGELTVMVSRSHLDSRTQAYLDSLPHTGRVGCGSSIKFCRLAEGAADHYPRLAPTHDWDVAAGHAILAAAGGSVIDPDGEPLAYGTPGLLIPAFLAWGGPAQTEGALKSTYRGLKG
jgi:3'(2'), 5'-bisphosphate nucleotidase